jgi:predicted HTH domain antitoxin
LNLEVKPRLRTELAVALCAQGILSLGKAAELATISRYAFADLVGERSIPRHYTGPYYGTAIYNTN